MILFDFPPFLVDFDDLVSIQVQITGHQIAHTLRAIFVCKDLAN